MQIFNSSSFARIKDSSRQKWRGRVFPAKIVERIFLVIFSFVTDWKVDVNHGVYKSIFEVVDVVQTYYYSFYPASFITYVVLKSFGLPIFNLMPSKRRLIKTKSMQNGFTEQIQC